MTLEPVAADTNLLGQPTNEADATMTTNESPTGATERRAWTALPRLEQRRTDRPPDDKYLEALERWRSLPAATRDGVSTLRLDWAGTLRRRFAIESGEIEGVYRLRPESKRRLEREGFESAGINDQVDRRHPAEHLRALLSDQLASVDTMHRHATRRDALDIETLQRWQAIATRHQESRTVEVEADEGTISRWRIPMVPGALKTTENVIVDEDTEYGFCPPEKVEGALHEMIRREEEHRHSGIATARCAAWLHGSFNNIHPFPDGNGRTDGCSAHGCTCAAMPTRPSSCSRSARPTSPRCARRTAATSVRWNTCSKACAKP